MIVFTAKGDRPPLPLWARDPVFLAPVTTGSIRGFKIDRPLIRRSFSGCSCVRQHNGSMERWGVCRRAIFDCPGMCAGGAISAPPVGPDLIDIVIALTRGLCFRGLWLLQEPSPLRWRPTRIGRCRPCRTARFEEIHKHSGHRLRSRTPLLDAYGCLFVCS